MNSLSGLRGFLSETGESAQVVTALKDWSRKCAIEAYRQKGLKTEEDIEDLINWLGEPKFSKKVICRTEGHVAPFTFVRDVLLDRVQNFIVWANRGGSKSYLFGLVTTKNKP